MSDEVVDIAAPEPAPVLPDRSGGYAAGSKTVSQLKTPPAWVTRVVPAGEGNAG